MKKSAPNNRRLIFFSLVSRVQLVVNYWCLYFWLEKIIFVQTERMISDRT